MDDDTQVRTLATLIALLHRCAFAVAAAAIAAGVPACVVSTIQPSPYPESRSSANT